MDGFRDRGVPALPGHRFDFDANELQRRACSAAGALAYIEADAMTDVSAELESVHCATLVLHNPANANVPFDEGRPLAAKIPGARFKTIETSNSLPLEGEPAFDELVRSIERFVREGREPHIKWRARDAADALEPSALRLVAGRSAEGRRPR